MPARPNALLLRHDMALSFSVLAPVVSSLVRHRLTSFHGGFIYYSTPCVTELWLSFLANPGGGV